MKGSILMDVKQIYSLVNDATKETIGDSIVLNEDLSNVVDLGKAVIGADAVDNYVKKLTDRIGKVIFVNRPYAGNVPSIMMDAWEYGSILQKISAEMPDAVENPTWKLTNGQSYDPNVFNGPKVDSKFFNNKTTFEIDMSFTEKQVKESFASVGEMNGFISMLYNEIDKSMTVKIDGLAKRTITNMIAQTFHSLSGAGNYSTGNVRCVNLLSLYNARFGTSLTADKALTDKEFIRFATMQMALYIDRLSTISKLFNIGGKARFTSGDMLKVVMLSDFKAASGAYLQSDTFHNDYVALPNADTVPYWQGSGTDYGFSSTSAIDVKTLIDGTATGVKASGILACMFDRDALGVSNLDRRVTTNYNPKAEFYNNFYKFDAGYYNDLNENFVVFYVADSTGE